MRLWRKNENNGRLSTQCFAKLLLLGMLGFLGTGRVAVAEEKVMQFIADPLSPDRGWVLTPDTLQFNPSLKKKAPWQVKFDRNVFRRVTSAEPDGANYRHRRIQPSRRKRGHLFLLIENGQGLDRKSYIFRTEDYGDSWAFSVMKSTSPSGSQPRHVAGNAETGDAGGAVDLNSLDSPTSTEAAKAPPTSSGGPPNPHVGAQSANPHGGGGGGMLGTPIFKFLFDLWLQTRPGINPLTFDNFHTLALVDIIPKPEIQFSFELSPNPRFYELDYQITPRFTLRAGRIWIPFDDMNPHNVFGGYFNTSRLAQPGANPFLPDIWADLGVGARFDLIDSKSLSLIANLYIVNGFQAGGTDPMKETKNYPGFTAMGSGVVDNNTDKAIGGRLQATINNLFSVGMSFYEGAYTPDGTDPKRIYMLGLDTQIRLLTGTTIRAGNVFMKVELPQESSSAGFTRGGLYGDLTQKIGPHYFVNFRAGATNDDDRVTTVADQFVVGGRIGYNADFFQISFIVHHDFKDVPGKVNRDLVALRGVLML